MSSPRSPLRSFLPAVALGLSLAWILASCRSQSTSYRYDPARAVHPHFSKENAYRHVEAQVALGPRPSGSRAIEKTRDYLKTQLREFGWDTEEQSFEDQTPIGPIQFSNLRARFHAENPAAEQWSRPVRLLIGSHFDTKYYTDIHFVGANDGGSSTGILLEMARVFASRPSLARQLELIFFDGEEAIESFTATDGLYGSRHYARTITRRQPRKHRPEAVVILDLLGEKSLNVQVPSDTPKHLRLALFDAAEELGYGSYFGVYPTPITDDHVPFQNEGIPAIDIIDLDYKAWHTSRDTLSQISLDSLEISGKTALLLIEKYLLSS